MAERTGGLPPPGSSRAAERLRALGHELPLPPPPVGHYTGARISGRWVTLSGHTDRGKAGRSRPGPLEGGDEELAVARSAAEHAAIHLLAAAGAVCHLDQLVLSHLRGYVAAVPEFGAHPEVIDAASLLLHEVLGGPPHTRAAIGVGSLPYGAVVELEAIFERTEL